MKLVYTKTTDRRHIRVQYGKTAEAIQEELEFRVVNPENIQGLSLCDCTQDGSWGCKEEPAICQCDCHRHSPC